ncbi:MAG: glycoside hydrolase family 2 [Clostridia bacterium]|nr:glycoside hydrolase family 2 [Clostridia bacterium]
MNYNRQEYPRPQFQREDWLALNGTWQFAYDDAGVGEAEGWYNGSAAFDKAIVVPFSYQYEASGIGDTQNHETVWYTRTFAWSKSDKRALLCFNGSDWQTDVWVNGKFATRHFGGFAPFKADITAWLKDGENRITVRCIDPFDPTISRGKQSWTGERFGCWYIANTGIWQSVWIETFGADCIDQYTLTPNIDELSFSGEITTLYGVADEAEIQVFYKGKAVKKQRFSLDGKHTRYTVRLMELDFVDESTYWTPENPNLYYVDFRLFKDGNEVDLAHTRFGMRKVSIDEQGKVCLNNRMLYQRLILDQGYWAESGITPPSVEAVKNDIDLAKAMGFNGARKHQKFEDPYFYWYAEEAGFLTWCEMPSAYNFNSREIYWQSMEWQEILSVARNFTSVICYVPLNESWGVRKVLTDANQQDYARSLYYLTKSIDSSRLVSTNDGWENLDITDIISVHDYAFDSSAFAEKYVDGAYDGLYPQGRKLFCEGCARYGQPVLFTEFGGIAMEAEAKDGAWGYGKGAEDIDEFLARLRNLMEGVFERHFQGYCYTQLTDVQQEVNGLLTPDRTPKVAPEILAEIFKK